MQIPNFLNKWSSLRGLNNGPVNIRYSIISVTVKIRCQNEIAIGVLGIFSVSIFEEPLFLNQDNTEGWPLFE